MTEMSDDNDRQRKFAIQLADITPPTHREALRQWASAMLELRGREVSITRKAKDALLITSRAKVIWPVLKTAAKQIKTHGWDNRSKSQRFGLGAAGTALAIFGTTNAGLVALGGGIAVPLWVVFGAGGMFASHLVDELARRQKDDSTASYTVIDAVKKDSDG